MKVNEKYSILVKKMDDKKYFKFSKGSGFETFLKIHNLSDEKKTVLFRKRKINFFKNYIKDLDYYFEPTKFKDPGSFLKKNISFPLK